MKKKENKKKSWIIDRFENGHAVLLDGKEELIIPRSMIPPSAKEGDALTAEFYLLKDETKRRENIARALLEEILGSQ